MLSDCTVHPTLPYRDFDRARQFYEGKLGFTPTDLRDGDVTYLGAGGTSFGLYPSQFAGTAQNTAMTFVTTDIDAEVAGLQARGVVFEEYDYPDFKTVNAIAAIPVGRVAWFKDTEGNIIGITQFN